MFMLSRLMKMDFHIPGIYWIYPLIQGGEKNYFLMRNKMQTPLISVVIAAYNAGKYMEECLNSIVNQTFQDWECIIVDDASTDNTLSIIQEFVTKDQRFRHDTLPANSGSAKVPRDKAVDDAQTDWILQVDADDFIDENVLERLYARAIQTDADIVFLRLKKFD